MNNSQAIALIEEAKRMGTKLTPWQEIFVRSLTSMRPLSRITGKQQKIAEDIYRKASNGTEFQRREIPK